MRNTTLATKALVIAISLLTVGGCRSGEPVIAPSVPSAPVASVQPTHSSALPSAPMSSGAAREAFYIDSFQSLVDQSDLVIIGQASAVAPGRNAGEDIGGRLAFRDVTVQVQQVLHGTYLGDTLTLEELGWKEGEPFTVNHAAWAAAGDAMLMGLKATTNGATATGPRYILTNSSARFFLEADGQVRDNFLGENEEREATPFYNQATELRVEELVEQVRLVGSRTGRPSTVAAVARAH